MFDPKSVAHRDAGEPVLWGLLSNVTGIGLLVGSYLFLFGETRYSRAMRITNMPNVFQNDVPDLIAVSIQPVATSCFCLITIASAVLVFISFDAIIRKLSPFVPTKWRICLGGTASIRPEVVKIIIVACILIVSAWGGGTSYANAEVSQILNEKETCERCRRFLTKGGEVKGRSFAADSDRIAVHVGNGAVQLIEADEILCVLPMSSESPETKLPPQLDRCRPKSSDDDKASHQPAPNQETPPRTAERPPRS